MVKETTSKDFTGDVIYQWIGLPLTLIQLGSGVDLTSPGSVTQQRKPGESNGGQKIDTSGGGSIFVVAPHPWPAPTPLATG